MRLVPKMITIPKSAFICLSAIETLEGIVPKIDIYTERHKGGGDSADTSPQSAPVVDYIFLL